MVLNCNPVSSVKSTLLIMVALYAAVFLMATPLAGLYLNACSVSLNPSPDAGRITRLEEADVVMTDIFICDALVNSESFYNSATSCSKRVAGKSANHAAKSG